MQPRITGNDIPDDIWRLIATYVQKSQLYGLISLNRTFFSVVLDEKYREVRWVQLDKCFMDMLSRLKSPIIAGHVQKLHIRPWFIYLLKRDALFEPPKRNNELRTSIVNIKSLFCNRKWSKENNGSSGKTSSLQGKLTGTLSPKKIINAMVRAVEGMKNVTEFYFEWRDLPLNKETSVFLTSTRAAFTASLRKLVLRAQICNFRKLLAITNYVYIDELDFHFDYTARATDKNGHTVKEPAEIVSDPDARHILEIVVPFIAHRRSILHSLTISSTSHTDLSDFWKGLPTMPSLRRLALGISFNKEHLSDSSGILHILKTHSLTLQHISFNPAYPELPFYDSGLVSQAKAASWAPINDDLLSDKVYLSGLESLKLPFISLHKTMPLLERSCDTLTSLRLSDYSLSFEEVESVVGLFSHRAFELQRLHLDVEDLSYQLLEMLALRLPRLYSLTLVYLTRLSYTLFLSLLYGPSSVAVTDWKLCDIGLYEARYQPPNYNLDIISASSYSEFHLMKMLYKQVPSIRMFKGFPLEHSRDLLGFQNPLTGENNLL